MSETKDACRSNRPTCDQRDLFALSSSVSHFKSGNAWKTCKAYNLCCFDKNRLVNKRHMGLVMGKGHMRDIYGRGEKMLGSSLDFLDVRLGFLLIGGILMCETFHFLFLSFFSSLFLSFFLVVLGI